ncbi:DNA topoisomerase-3 [Neorhodopirellula lusitana]|uniref:DNA topoisomerase n=1 Tax=Neorhodopirellula lusitana TaxID=445327 RepID=A0ABY1Q9Y1_9BACT|nr:DNA topoisomerase 3 [Neorhodopirellula lusitana]SMP64242.1 DNA topoisomerase-3 [Neorhodopirellula lusitana]
MKVILAEKPSVARDLASFLKASQRLDGYLEGGGYQVTWAFGHLVELSEPGDYDPALKRWSLDSLPFIPDSFRLRLRGDEGAQKQFAIIKRLFRAADSLICATDAGREGELIFRYIQSLSGCTSKPTERLWLSSLTPAAIGTAFRSIRPLSDYDHLYEAARCRSQADWVVGLNATRNYTVRYRSAHHVGKGGATGLLWSLGRVQTPVLAMIVGRDDEIQTFRVEPFWELMTQYRDVQFRFTGERFSEQDAAEEQLKRAAAHPLQIRKTDRRAERSQPPQLYDLTELQRDMNRRYGISAADTLAAAQSLYEAKLVTYPRTDSRYLTKDMRKEVPKVLTKLRNLKPTEIGKLDLQALPFTGRIVNDNKVTDHHAIIPTGAGVGVLPDRQAKVYDAIVVQFIAAFYPECVKEITQVHAIAGEIPFRARGVRVVSPGWTELFPRKAKKRGGDNADDAPQSLPDFKHGESGPHQPYIKEGQTSPPKHFTENTLLAAMDTAGKFVDEAELREALKEKGLGTPATRAATIETLLHRKYIARDRKNILATDLGRYLVVIVKDHHLTSPELTGEWEAKLKQIEAGNLSPDVFMGEIADYTQAIVRGSDSTKIDHSVYGACPRCGERVIHGKTAFGCSAWRTGCSFVLPQSYRGVNLTVDQIRELLQLHVTGQPMTIDGGQPFLLALCRSGPNTGALMEVPVPQGDEQDEKGQRASGKKPRAKKAAGSRSSAKGAAGKSTTKGKRGTAGSDAGQSAGAGQDSGAGQIGVCPLCGKPVVEQTKSYGCSHWRDGCKFAIWKTIAGKKVSVTNAKKLLRKGETPVIKGFRSKAGKLFDAKLKLTDGKVGFEF